MHFATLFTTTVTLLAGHSAATSSSTDPDAPGNKSPTQSRVTYTVPDKRQAGANLSSTAARVPQVVPQKGAAPPRVIWVDQGALVEKLTPESGRRHGRTRHKAEAS
ncbi:hypothetical protein PspLS_01883 [Pyricularia sp. CBS 133598]|nr:hypothetical protein PspLS_01883 [Pyricularia sp. CBS 133598]